jgi:hypothetical protein
MSSRVCGEILVVFMLTIMLILKLVFFLSNEKEAVEIDLGAIEGWQLEHLPAQPEIIGKE